MLLLEYDSLETLSALAPAAGCADAVERFSADDGRRALAVADTRRFDAGAAVTHEVRPVFAQGRCGPAAGGSHLFCVGLWVPHEHRDEFLAWYEREHVPMLLECPAWIGCRFVEERILRGAQFYALHELTSPAALDSEARRRSRATPWFRRLARAEWFDGPFDRRLYRRIVGARGA